MLAPLLLLAAATTALVLPRAGGPAFVPIPANCTVPNPLPARPGHRAHNHSTDGWAPNATLATVYAVYLEEPDFETPAARWEGCLEQCNGFDGCVAAFLGYEVPTPVGYYGTGGGTPSVACLMYGVKLHRRDFVRVDEGYVNATAGNIDCPAGTS